MKGNPKLLKTLNSLLADEMTAINQYVVHAEMCADWGYDKLHDHFEKRAIDEMKHMGKLIARILFLDGRPVVGNLNAIHIGAEVPKMFANDQAAEADAIKAYNNAIVQAGEVKDYATREILEGVLQDEDRHMNEIEENLDQIQQMGLANFLTGQV